MKRRTSQALVAIVLLTALIFLKHSLDVLPTWKLAITHVNQHIGIESEYPDLSSDVSEPSAGGFVVWQPDQRFGTPVASGDPKPTSGRADIARPPATSTSTAIVEHSALQASTTSAAIESALTTAKAFDRIVVMGRTKDEDTSWVAEKLSGWQSAIYSVDNHSEPLYTPTNKGREANVYLTYIIDHYNLLPSTIAFVHSHEDGWPRAWHTDAEDHSNVVSLNNLNVNFVQRNGYANLRCIDIPGCPDEIQPFRNPREDDRTAEHAYAAFWKDVFNNTNVPQAIATPCCAQFAVSKTQVLKRPREFYVQALKVLHDTKLDDNTSGRVFEYMWHIMFGQDAVYCPPLDQCYSDVYGDDS